MWTLALDTSASVTAVALAKDGDIVFTQGQLNSASYSHAEEMSAIVSRALAEAGIQSSDLSTLVYGAGPGSFTGLRISLGFLKGLAFALKIPLVAIPSLCAYADEFLTQNEYVLSVSDAGRGEFFGALYSCSQGEILAPQVLTEEMLKSCVRGKCSSGAKWVGYVESGKLAQQDVVEPRYTANSLISIARRSGGVSWDGVEELSELAPLYLRKVNAKTITERGLQG